MGRVETVQNPLPLAAALQPEDVKAIRYKLNQSQADFAMMIGVSIATLQAWEEGRHHPDGPAQALLRVAAKNPRIVAKALGRA
ncbi:MAG TPA: helix-turn-helix domain-containing protein [Thermoanaerobaculia bacterium]|nr:helix-turn-helix domain-containing protein [Thermoanaerobaculia bacterium]